MNWDEVHDARDFKNQPSEESIDAFALECPPHERICCVATPMYYQVDSTSRGGPLALLVTSKRILIGKQKVFGGMRLGWSCSIGDLRQYGSGPHGSVYKLHTTLNRGFLSLIFQSFDSMETVTAHINMAAHDAS
jgi:hypothetical protein